MACASVDITAEYLELLALGVFISFHTRLSDSGLQDALCSDAHQAQAIGYILHQAHAGLGGEVLQQCFVQSGSPLQNDMDFVRIFQCL